MLSERSECAHVPGSPRGPPRAAPPQAFDSRAFALGGSGSTRFVPRPNAGFAPPQEVRLAFPGRWMQLEQCTQNRFIYYYYYFTFCNMVTGLQCGVAEDHGLASVSGPCAMIFGCPVGAGWQRRVVQGLVGRVESAGLAAEET